LKKVLFICENESGNQSTKHRVIDVAAFLGISGYRLYCGRPVTIGRSRVMLISFSDYCRIVRDVPAADLIFVQRMSTIGILLVCLYARLLRKEIVFDVDDAVFTKRVRGVKNPLYACFDAVARLADYVFAGSHYIMEYARRLNERTLLVPTAVNTAIFDAGARGAGAAGPKREFVVGWLGAGEIHMPSLLLLREPLRALAEKHRIAFKMVSSLGSRRIREAFGDVAGIAIDYGPDRWLPLEEIPRAMADFDVSVMPLVDTPYARGKCALKALESMAMRIPVVASRVGEGAHVIRHGENGYLAGSTEEWVGCIEELIADEPKRRRIAESGYETVARGYTIPVVAKRIEEILKIGGV
jgi:glycosyltransferase involved in cell wall biosynthesis